MCGFFVGRGKNVHDQLLNLVIDSLTAVCQVLTAQLNEVNVSFKSALETAAELLTRMNSARAARTGNQENGTATPAKDIEPTETEDAAPNPAEMKQQENPEETLEKSKSAAEVVSRSAD